MGRAGVAKNPGQAALRRAEEATRAAGALPRAARARLKEPEFRAECEAPEA